MNENYLKSQIILTLNNNKNNIGINNININNNTSLKESLK